MKRHALRPARHPPRLLGLVMALALVSWALSGELNEAASAPPKPTTAAVTVSGTAPLTPVPHSFFGLSTEYWSLPLYARQMAIFERVLRMLQVPGAGAMVLRIGGDSADHAVWDPHGERLPGWAFGLTPRWVALARTLVRTLGVRLILDLNLVTDSPAAAARWAGAAVSMLPRRSIAGFEIGNEPDIYSHRYWEAMTGGRPIADRTLPSTLSPDGYVAAFDAYEAALDRVAPGVPLLGPATANPRAHWGWVAALVAHPPRGLAVVTVHRYPYSACVPPRSPTFPSIPRLLSPKATAGMAASLIRVIRLAHAAHLPIRVDELNSVTCSGRPGVSNTFATALWAPDALMSLVRAGVAGVDVHIRAAAINSPFTLGPRGLTARPLLYGLVLFTRALGTHAELARLRVRTLRSVALDAWAVRVSSDALHVLLINDGRRTLRVSLRLPTTGSAWIERMLAPSLAARSGVTLDGQQLGPRGTWLRRPAQLAVRPGRSGYRLLVPPYSAVLLSARLLRGALASRPVRVA